MAEHKHAGDGAVFWRSRLGRSLLSSLIVFGAAIALFLSASELYLEYELGLGAIESRLDEIERSHAAAAVDRMWAVDPVGLQLLAAGIASLPDIRYVEIREADESHATLRPIVMGTKLQSHALRRTIPLMRDRDGLGRVVGELYVEATEEELFAHLVKRGMVILGQQVLKAFLLALFFLFVVHRAVVRHILDLSNRVAAFGGIPASTAATPGGDEIARLLTAFEAMKESIVTKNEVMRRREQSQRMLLDNCPFFVWMKDADSNLLVANREYARVAKAATVEELEGKTDFDLFPADLAEKYVADDRLVMHSGKPHYIVETYADEHGRRHSMETWKAPLVIDGRIVGTVGYSRDITERLQLQEMLLRQEHQYRTLAENSPDLIIRYDRDCRRVYVNPTYEKVTGLNRADVLDAAPGAEWASETPVEEYHAILRHVSETREPARRQMTWMNARSGVLNIHEMYFVPEPGDLNQSAGVLAIGRDITERTLAQQAVQQSNALLRAVLKALPDLVWMKDTEGRYRLCNRPFERFFGAPEDEIVGKTDYDFVDKELADFFRQKDQAAIAAAGIQRNEEEIVYAEDGQRAMLETRKVPVYGAGGELMGVLGVARDVTEQRAMETAVAEAQRLEALGHMAGGLAHDFNNLLGAILGFADLIVEDTGGDDTVNVLAKRIIGAGEHGKALVAQLLSSVRRSDLQFTCFRLNTVVEEIRVLLEGSIPSTTRVQVILAEDGSAVTGDRNQIAQMLINLCINAHHALDGGHGEIAVAVGPTRQRPEITAHLYRHTGPAETVETWADSNGTAYAVVGQLSPDRDYHVVHVSDTGCGMDEGLLAQIFSPFFTTKGPGKGTGLGLSMVRGIVVSHGGALIVESRKGQGTGFEVFLPAAREDEVPAVEAAVAAPPPDLRGRRVLFVDDNVHFCDMLSAILERMGMEVAPCTDPREALESVDEFGCVWDVLITDQTMPHMTGLELIRAVHERCPDLPAILCTGFAEESLDDDMLKQAGVFALLRKPIEGSALAAALARAVASRTEEPDMQLAP